MRSLASPTAFALSAALALTTAALTTACGGDGAPEDGERWRAVRDTLADTVVVRTVAGRVWADDATLIPEVVIGVLDGAEEYMFGAIRSIAVGPADEIYVMDAQVPALRVYDPDGGYRATLGGEGEGPGEYRRPDGGLAVLSDGRVVLRDPSNARFNVYSPEGAPLETWTHRGGFNTSRKLFRDRDDNVWTTVLVDPEATVFDWVMGLAQYRSDGTPGDTLVEPATDYEAPTLSGQREGNTSVRTVPFSPNPAWTMSPEGYLVTGVSTAYAFTLRRPGSPLRIERVADPVPVLPGERRQARERESRIMRDEFPGWTWNGPEVPAEKPAFQSLHVGEDGRVWVWLSGRGVEAQNPDHDPDEPGSFPTTWREEVAFDVFEPDGRYLGRVHAPMELSRYPEPIFGTDRVWAVARDDLDVQKVVVYRIEHRGETLPP